MRKIFILMIGSALLQCARQTQPSGGPKDTDVPALIESRPADGEKNYRGKTIELIFDEYVKLKDPKEEILITPSAGAKTKFTVKKNKVIILPELPWKDSTTYSLAFRNAIQDITESNAADNLHLAFSTGPIIDSLTIQGTVREVFKEKIPDKITIALYQSDTFNIFQHKPIYFTRSDKKGKFIMRNLKAGKYFIYAFDDKSKNMKVDSKGEMFGFSSTPISLPENADSIRLTLVHIDARPPKVTSVRNSSTISTIRFNKAVDSIALKTKHTPITYTYGDSHSELIVYKNFDKTDSVDVKIQASDSLYQKIDTAVFIKFTETKKIAEKFKPSEWKVEFDPTNNDFTAEQTSNKLITSINYDSIYIQIDSSTYQTIKPANLTLDTLFKKITLKAKLKINPKEKIPTPVLLLGKGAFITVDNDSTKSQDVKIKIPKSEETGSIAIEITTQQKHFEVQLVTSDLKLVKSVRDQPKFTFTYIKPAEYRIIIIVDENNNQRWEPGDYTKKIEPEKVILYKNLENKYTIPVRANWEIGPLTITF